MFSMSVYSTVQMDEVVNSICPHLGGGQFQAGEATVLLRVPPACRVHITDCHQHWAGKWNSC